MVVAIQLSSERKKMAQISGYLVINVTALANPGGTITAPDLKAGDRILQAVSPGLYDLNVNVFEGVVSVDGQLKQFAAPVDLAGIIFEILVLRL
jgi:hypothetical protein